MRLIDKPLTEKQKKFAEIYVTSSGKFSNTEVAIEAGYDYGSAYQRAYELLNPEICPHVVKFISEIRKDISTKYEISKDNHMEELWNIREDAKKKDNQMVRLRAEEDRGKMMGYYIERRAVLTNTNIDDMSLKELYAKMETIQKKNRFMVEKRKAMEKTMEGKNNEKK
jgi:phage terminase small subunit